MSYGRQNTLQQCDASHASRRYVSATFNDYAHVATIWGHVEQALRSGRTSLVLITDQPDKSDCWQTLLLGTLTERSGCLLACPM